MFENLFRNIFGSCGVASPNSRVLVDEVKNGSKVSNKYDSDVKALKERYRIEYETGVCIRIPLKEILEICPRVRKRVDAYTGLVSHLKREYGVELVINSNKSK
jgi:hypothetical protein